MKPTENCIIGLPYQMKENYALKVGKFLLMMTGLSLPATWVVLMLQGEN
jgi:hypothetical protein